jgi:hypothetical protein
VAEAKWLDGQSVLPQTRSTASAELKWLDGRSGILPLDVTSASPQTITGQDVSFEFVADAGTLNLRLTLAGQDVSFEYVVSSGTLRIASGGVQTGGGSIQKRDRPLIRRYETDLRSRVYTHTASGGISIFGSARVRTHFSDLDSLPFNPIVIPAIPDDDDLFDVRLPDIPRGQLDPLPVPPPPPPPRTSSFRGMGGVRIANRAAEISAVTVRFTTRKTAKIPPRRRAVVGLGYVYVVGEATVTPVSWHKALLRDDDDAIQLLLETDSI